MEGFDITALAEIVGGGLILIYAIFQVCLKVFGDIGFFKKRKEAKLKKEKADRRKEYKEFFEHGADEIVPAIEKKIDSVNEAQNQRLDLLINSSNDLLRKELTRVYYKYLPYKKIPRYIKEEIFVLYKDYKAQGGNSFIDEIFEEIKTWQVVQSEEEVYEKSN